MKQSLFAFDVLDRQLRLDVAIDRAVSKMRLPSGTYWHRKLKTALSIPQLNQICENVNGRYVINNNTKEVEIFSNNKPDLSIFGV